jgi:hypothetical protein
LGKSTVQEITNTSDRRKNHLWIFDKILLAMDGSIGGVFLLVKGYFASKSRGWQCGWEREVKRRPPF